METQMESTRDPRVSCESRERGKNAESGHEEIESGNHGNERAVEDHANAKHTRPTTVVRIRNSQGKVVQDCDVYIGRRVKRGGWDLPYSDWANPFTVWDWGSPVEAQKRFEHYIRFERSDLLERLPELRGKRLGCWCKPYPCHGDILVKLLNEFFPQV